MNKDTIIVLLVLLNLAFLSKSFVLVSNNNTETATNSIDKAMYLSIIEKITSKENTIKESASLQKHLIQLLEENKSDRNEYMAELASIKASLEPSNQPLKVENKPLEANNQLVDEVVIPKEAQKPNKGNDYRFKNKSVKHLHNPNVPKLITSNDELYLVDTISEMFFKTANLSKGGNSFIKKPSKKVIYNSTEHRKQRVKKSNVTQKKQIKGISKHAEILSVDRLNNKKDVKNYLKAKGVTKEIKGFYIHLMTSNHLLEADHVLFQTFGGLKVEVEGKNKYHYYIGGFSSRNLAEKHKKKVIDGRYPASKVVYFKKGKRKSKAWQFFLAPLSKN